MENQKVFVQHEENKQWMNKLLFYQDEIKVMRNRIQEIASKYTSKDILSVVEHFQNRLIISQDNIDKLKHEINLSNDNITQQIKKNIVAIDRQSVKNYSPLRESIESFERVFSEMKTELNLFLIKWM